MSDVGSGDLLEDGGEPFTQVPDELLFDMSVSADALRLWMWVKSHARKKSVAWPGVAGAQEAFGWSESTVKRRIAELVEAGWVKRRRRMGSSTRTFLCRTKWQLAPWEATTSERVRSDLNESEQVRSDPTARSDLTSRTGHLLTSRTGQQVTREPEEVTTRTEPDAGRCTTDRPRRAPSTQDRDLLDAAVTEVLERRGTRHQAESRSDPLSWLQGARRGIREELIAAGALAEIADGTATAAVLAALIEPTDDELAGRREDAVTAGRQAAFRELVARNNRRRAGLACPTCDDTGVVELPDGGYIDCECKTRAAPLIAQSAVLAQEPRTA